jgi:DNA-3-methyladenine glycosylase
MRLTVEFYRASTLTVARRLLGKRFVRRLPSGIVSGLIVEVEAYLWRGDSACHAAKGMKERNRIMFGTPGLLYVYPIHAKYCMNVVTEKEGRGAAVLIRAIEPDAGIELMRDLRPVEKDVELTNGPGKLCSSLAIDRHCNGIDLLSHPDVWIEETEHRPSLSTWSIHRSGRIGISAAQEKLWRFFVDGNRYVSGRARDHRRKPVECLVKPER